MINDYTTAHSGWQGSILKYLDAFHNLKYGPKFSPSGVSEPLAVQGCAWGQVKLPVISTFPFHLAYEMAIWDSTLKLICLTDLNRRGPKM